MSALGRDIGGLLICMECILPAAVAAGGAGLGVNERIGTLIQDFMGSGPLARSVGAGAVVYASVAVGRWIQDRIMQVPAS